ncbi:NAD-dependent epimerase/dehydratase family protein [Pandoraea sputorum]|uniref:polysaccharide biosynthesis C-terminal domain-containing protein n=1 Tax=Pandoraea sputorum TaxID=93222 RepID=UPI001E4F443B|nr:NAD-dependent epimerase/dehydratase family protein [Pandoraea sputorum]MCE4061561.1 NAD-dependent epimerase/dehydratase family protein [Pandoraea sputorum]
MTTIGITGSNGLIAWHLRSFLSTNQALEIVCADRETFAQSDLLEAFVKRCDVIVHLAGANRGDEAEVTATNVGLADALVAACEAMQVAPYVIYSNSTHIYRGTPYGHSKRAAAETLRAWASRSGAKLTNLILPNVFGEHGRPFYNSVVATFCHQLVNGQTPEIKVDATFDYVHCHEVSSAIGALIAEPVDDEQLLPGRPISVTQLLALLTKFQKRYRDEGVIPALADKFELALFNTYRSYLFPQHYPTKLLLRTDPRGSLFEAVKTDREGQAFLSTTHPDITRGNHFHFFKIERFLVLSGEATIRLRRLLTDEITEFRVSGDSPCYVDMPTLHTHNITNTGSGELLTMFWSGDIFDPANPDTFAEPV